MRSTLLYSALYKYIKTKFPTVEATNNFVDFNKDNSLGIYAEDVAPIRSMLNGRKYNGRRARIQFRYLCTQSQENAFSNKTFLFSLEEYILALQNVELVTETNYKFNTDDEPIHIDEPTADDKGIVIGIGSTDLISSVRNVGKSPDGRPMFTINVALTYFIGGNKQ